MALARNKKVDPEAIKAFGSAADARPEPARPTEPAREAIAAPAPANEPAPAKMRPKAAAGESHSNNGPTSSLVRWSDDELRELRDQLIAYSKNERYSMQQVMTRAMRIGIEQLSSDSR